MNCKSAQNRILLEQSGELSWWGRPLLRSHLTQCSSCRAFRLELLRLTEAVRRVPWEEGFSPAAPPRVMAAERRRPEHGPSWQPAFAYAALSVLLTLAFVLVMRPFNLPREAAVSEPEAELAWDTDLEDRITYLDNLMNSTVVEGMEGQFPGTDSGEVDALARQLLALEGEQI